jgi:hypothetical protein
MLEIKMTMILQEVWDPQKEKVLTQRIGELWTLNLQSWISILRGAIEHWNPIHEVNCIDHKLKLNVGQDAPKQQKKSNYCTQIKSISNEQALKASAPAAANKNMSLPKFTPMLDTLMDCVANVVKGHRCPHGQQE